MTREAALHIFPAHAEELTGMGVKSIALFGSLARGENRSDSDVDVLVEIDHQRHPFGMFAYLRLKERLEQLLGRPVDLVEREALHPALRERILAEAVRAA
ncbi:MAG: nucleotidyltransferase family protein [Phycisphaeraceae bacterium]